MEFKYKTVYTKTHTLLIDDCERSLPIGTWVWNDVDNDIYETERDDFGNGYPQSDHVYEVIASYPKIEGILEFSELPHNIENIDELATNYACTMVDKVKWVNIRERLAYYNGCRHGYKARQEKMYSLEDIKKAIQIAQSTSYIRYEAFSGNSIINHNYDTDEIIDTINNQYRFLIQYEDKGFYNENGIWENKMERKVENNKIFGKWKKVID